MGFARPSGLSGATKRRVFGHPTWILDVWCTRPGPTVVRVTSGDRTAARQSYQDFLALCKDADPDIPVLKEAKAEYAKLQ
jgi:hypothetical protein